MKRPVEMRQVIARIADASAFLEFKGAFGPATVCGHAAICGYRVGIVTNNGPLDPAGSTKVTHFIQSCEQAGLPIVWLQNTTGFIVGTEAERAGMIKHGSKQIQAAVERHRAAAHRAVRRLLRRRQLRHVRARLSSALRLQLADREDRRDGRRAGRRHDGDRDARRRGAQGRAHRRSAARRA